MKYKICSVAAALLTLLVSGCVTSTLKITPAEPGRVSRNGSPVAYSLKGMNSGVYICPFSTNWYCSRTARPSAIP